MFPIKTIGAADRAFPTTVHDFIPPYEEIRQFRNHPKWSRLFADMFFCGLESIETLPKEGVDEKAALAHINYVMRSWEPKHEHKEAGCCFLFNEWFEDIEWKAKAFPKVGT